MWFWLFIRRTCCQLTEHCFTWIPQKAQNRSHWVQSVHILVKYTIPPFIFRAIRFNENIMSIASLDKLFFKHPTYYDPKYLNGHITLSAVRVVSMTHAVGAESIDDEVNCFWTHDMLQENKKGHWTWFCIICCIFWNKCYTTIQCILVLASTINYLTITNCETDRCNRSSRWTTITMTEIFIQMFSLDVHMTNNGYNYVAVQSNLFLSQ